MLSDLTMRYADLKFRLMYFFIHLHISHILHIYLIQIQFSMYIPRKREITVKPHTHIYYIKLKLKPNSDIHKPVDSQDATEVLMPGISGLVLGEF